LGIVTSATLKLTHTQPGSATIVAYFADLADAGRAVIACLDRPNPPTLLEIMDQVTLRAVEEWQAMDLDTEAAALLLIQVPDDGLMAGEVSALAAACEDNGATSTFSTTDPHESTMLLHARRVAFEALERRGTPLLEDVAVDVSRLPELLERIQQIARRHRVTVGTFGHAGDGNLHPIVVIENASLEAQSQAKAAFEEIMTATLELDGTISGEHGVGLLKLPFLHQELSPAVLKLMSSVKAAFDPLSIMNPGKTVPLPDVVALA
jgi:FAD/FMN-containing dehydrogenase